MEHVTTLVVDEQPLIRYALRTLIESAGECQEIAEAGSGAEALAKCRRVHPDLVITELTLTGERVGIGICRFAKRALRGTAVLVLTADSSPSAVAAALNAGADSFVHKSAGDRVVGEAIRRTRAGERTWLVGAETAPQPTPPPSPPDSPPMTSREEEVLALVLCRRSNDEIADQLHLARQTVKNYVSCVLRKLGFTSRRDLFRSLDLRPSPSAAGPPRRPG